MVQAAGSLGDVAFGRDGRGDWGAQDLGNEADGASDGDRSSWLAY